MAQDNSDDDDYMSDKFLHTCGDMRPGLVSDRVAKQYHKEIKHESTNAVNRGKNKPRQSLECEQREEGLKNALSAENKGFKLLEKMGYKPGTAIGKSGVGRVEPVPLNIKSSRTGLGEEAERKRKADQQKAAMLAMRSAMANKRQRHELEWKQTLRTKLTSREVERDLDRSQKVCEQLNSEQGITAPERRFYWPAALLPSRDGDDEDEEQCNDDDECEDDESGEQLSADEQLELLTAYLRSTYRYCIWCGTAFNDENDMLSNCPGNTADDHR